MSIIQTLQAIRCDCIINAYEMNESNPYQLFLEPCINGSLRSYLTYITYLPVSFTRTFVYEVSLALVHMKSYNCLHRDLTAKNCLLSANGHIKVSDFASSKLLPFGNRACTVVGSLHSMAPEMAARHKGYGFEIDWWALGILCYEMLTGMPPRFEKKIVDGMPDSEAAMNALKLDAPISNGWHFSEVDEFWLYYPLNEMKSSYTKDQIDLMSFERIASLHSREEQMLLQNAHRFIQLLLTINPTTRQEHINRIPEHPWLLNDIEWEIIRSRPIDLGDYCPYPELVNLLTADSKKEAEHTVNGNDDSNNPFSNF